MTKKIGRNDPCPCGSGKKYKKCCLGKEDDYDFANPANILESYKKVRKESHIKQCLYPDHTKCTEKIISAHSIQNNKILKKISDNGQVYMPCPKVNNPFEIQTIYGRKEASVFTGFCGYHDKTIFQPIEDKDFTGTNEQIFLYIYRAFAIEFHKKQESMEIEKKIYSKLPSLINDNNFVSPFNAVKLAIEDFKVEKEIFDQALLGNNYDVLTSFVWEFPHFSNFAGSGYEAPITDLTGKILQDLTDENSRAAHIFYSVFPENNSTYAIIAWLKVYDELFAPIKEQLSELNDIQRKNYINNSLPIVSENIAIKPSSWDKLSKKQQDEFASLIWGMSLIYEQSGTHFDRTKAPMYDMFSF